jgi:hypothetical protein
LPRIDPAQRQDEAIFNKKFNEAKPRLLGALLDKLSESMRELPNVKLAEKPRMADFAAFAYAGFGQEFLDRYKTNREDANENALQNSPLGEALLKFFESLVVPQWKGTAKNLIDELVKVVDYMTVQDKDFPKKPNILSGELKRIEPNLLTIGWKVDRVRESSKERMRLITITRLDNTTNQSSQSSESSATSSGDNKSLDSKDKTLPIETKTSDDEFSADDDKNGDKSNHPSVSDVAAEVTVNSDGTDDTDDKISQSSLTPLKVEEEREITEI